VCNRPCRRCVAYGRIRPPTGEKVAIHYSANVHTYTAANLGISVCPLRKSKKVKGLGTCYRLALITRLEQQRFTISEVAADWHELMIPSVAHYAAIRCPRRRTIGPAVQHTDIPRPPPNQRTRPSPRSP